VTSSSLREYNLAPVTFLWNWNREPSYLYSAAICPCSCIISWIVPAAQASFSRDEQGNTDSAECFGAEFSEAVLLPPHHSVPAMAMLNERGIHAKCLGDFASLTLPSRTDPELFEHDAGKIPPFKRWALPAAGGLRGAFHAVIFSLPFPAIAISSV